jgi:hypothetical protein
LAARIKDAQVIRLIEQIGEHYRTNISNRFLRPVLLQLPLDKSTWDQIEALTEKMEMYIYEGFHLDELYRQLAACARFVDVARNGMANLKNKINAVSGGQDKILRDMAASNFKSNLQVLADLLNELYMTLVELDKINAQGQKPLYQQMPELISIGRQLVGH